MIRVKLSFSYSDKDKGTDAHVSVIKLNDIIENNPRNQSSQTYCTYYKYKYSNTKTNMLNQMYQKSNAFCFH